MPLVVKKFGGTSVADPEKIMNVVDRVLKSRDEGHDVVVVLSAMAGETNRFIDLALRMQKVPDPREMDVLLASGEQVTVSLFAMGVKARGGKAVSLLGDQVRITTDKSHTRARIKDIDSARIKSLLAEGNVVVVAGFQGVTEEGDLTTLGRGGSDTTAVALASALGADSCEIYTDVEGVFTTDPNVCPSAKKIDRITYDEMLELASLGAKVLDIRSVGIAKKYEIPVHVRSTFTERTGTWVVKEDQVMESRMVSGVTYSKNEVRITVARVPDTPGIASRIFGPISDAGIVVDMIIQNARAGEMTDMTFTVPRTDFARAMEIVEKVAEEIGAERVGSSTNIAKVSIVGVGMRNHAGVASTAFKVLSDEGINIRMISTSEIKVSCVIEEKYTELAVRTLHDAFGLGEDSPPIAEN